MLIADNPGILSKIMTSKVILFLDCLLILLREGWVNTMHMLYGSAIFARKTVNTLELLMLEFFRNENCNNAFLEGSYLISTLF